MANVASIPVQYAWHIHHGVLIEPLLEGGGIEKRKNYIKNNKSTHEINLRLHLLRPAYNVPAFSYEYNTSGDVTNFEDLKELRNLHSQQCDPLCPWESFLIALRADGKFTNSTIFTWYDPKFEEFTLKNNVAPWRKDASQI